jgi:SAM-dependent methyltransferase
MEDFKMGQVTSGMRAVFSNPIIYSAFQRLMGAHSFRIKFVEEFVRPFPGCSILDIGCGPADILDYLPDDVNYWGFDISDTYIARAKKRFGQRGKFCSKVLTHQDLEKIPQVDIVMALAVLHHLDDKSAKDVLCLAKQALKTGGRLVTFDACLDPSQNPIARFLVKSDRGKNVRSREEYSAIAAEVYDSWRVEVRQRIWIPYTHCFMECTRR